MGCGGSAGNEYKAKIDEAEELAKDEKVRRPNGEHRALEDVVKLLTEAHEYFVVEKGGKSKEQVGRMQKLAGSLTRILVDEMDIQLLRRKDLLGQQDIYRIARQVDPLCGEQKATKAVEKKQASLHKEMVSEYLSQLDSAVSRLTQPAELVEGSKQCLVILRNVQLHISPVPELVPKALQHSTVLSGKIMAHWQNAVESESQLVPILQGVAEGLDSVCVALEKGKGDEKIWNPLTPRLREAVGKRGADVAPSKIDDLESELEKRGQFDPQDLINLMLDLAPWCINLPNGLQERIAKILDQIEQRVNEAFDQAILGGRTNRMDMLLVFARSYDPVCIRIDRRPRTGSETPLPRELEKKKAGVTLKILLAGASTDVGAQVTSLHESCRKCEAEVRKIPRDQFDSKESVTWKFKLRSGVYKSYAPGKSEEVEGLYQEWVDKGKPADGDQKRATIAIKVDAHDGRKAPKDVATASYRQDPGQASTKRRARCKYGEQCFRKNAEHKLEFAHPGDWDWDPNAQPPQPSDSSKSVGSGSGAGVEIREERYCLDFQLMTQVNVTRGGGMRTIVRAEGLTKVQKATREYFQEFRDFIESSATVFDKAEIELRRLGEPEREEMQRQVHELLDELRPVVAEFLKVAVSIMDMKVIDEICALLGERADHLDFADQLKDVKLQDLLTDVEQAYAPRGQNMKRATPERWKLIRQLFRNKLLQPRLSLRQWQHRHQIMQRRNVQMRCQGLLDEYSDDTSFCASVRKEAIAVLASAARRKDESQMSEALKEMLRTAKSWECQMDDLLDAAGSWVAANIQSACSSKLQPLERVGEILDIGNEYAKLGGTILESYCEMEQLLPVLAGRAMREVVVGNGMPESVKGVVAIHARLGPAGAAFSEAFWVKFKPYLETLDDGQQGPDEGTIGSDEKAGVIEWAIAYCEQTKEPLPPWMMKKDQLEALRRLKEALSNRDELTLREAVIFAKQTDLGGGEGQELKHAFDKGMTELKRLKRLPTAWEVTDLVGESTAERMFKKADVEMPALKALFQQIFDDTKAAVWTRDRKGDIPRNYRVERVIAVMNADNWGQYLSKKDEIVAACLKLPDAGKNTPWPGYGGQCLTKKLGEEITKLSKLPEMDENANEIMLFHGTKPESADLIAQNHFDMSFACKTGLFGAGLYFAESGSKSDEYVKPDKSNHYPIILARVSLGRVNYCSAPDPVRDPGRERLEGSCIKGEYHSVLGDRKKAKGTYREFVVYDHYQVYPQFIVWYSRH